MSNIESANDGQYAELGNIASTAARLGNYTKSSSQKVIESRGLQAALQALFEKFGAKKVPATSREEPEFDVVSYDQQTRRLIWRWGLISTLLTAGFWLVWLASAGSVPVITQILWMVSSDPDVADTFIQLPFAVSRWWDVLWMPIWVMLLIGLIRWTNRAAWESALEAGLAAGLLFGLLFGPDFGLGVGLGFGLAVGLAIGLAVGLVFGRAAGPNVGLAMGLTAGLGVGLGFGLAVGLAIGLAVGLVFGLVVGLGFGLILGFKYLLRQRYQDVGRWLAGH